MSGSEDEREDFGAAEQHSLLHGKLSLFFSLSPSSEEGPSLFLTWARRQRKS